jgi:hypothetical protein
MRVIIEPSYDLLSQWAANYVANRLCWVSRPARRRWVCTVHSSN